MAKYLVTVATTVYHDIELEATDRDDAWQKGMNANIFVGDGKVYEEPYIENIEELDA